MKRARLLIWRSLLTLGLLVAGTYTSACAYLYANQSQLIFKPSLVKRKTPKDFQLSYQELWLPIKTGSKTVGALHAWWIPTKQPERGTLLYFHGNGVNISSPSSLVQVERFHRMGLSTLMISYRGYGRSQGGFPTETQLYEDATTAWNYLVNERQIPANHIFLYGYSLGGAIAIDLAAKNPQAAGLIVQSSFTSMQAMVDRQLNQHYWSLRFFPVHQLLTQRFDSIRKVKTLQMPVLFIHGTADPYIPATMSQTLYAAAPEPKQLLLVPNAKHGNSAKEFGKPENLHVVQRFVEQARSR